MVTHTKISDQKLMRRKLLESFKLEILTMGRVRRTNGVWHSQQTLAHNSYSFTESLTTKMEVKSNLINT